MRREIEEVIGISAADAILASARQGTGIDLVLEAIVHRVPHPQGERNGALRALIFDAKYDAYRGVVDATCASSTAAWPQACSIRMMHNRSEFVVDEVGVFSPAMTPVDELLCGEVGYFIASIKDVRDSKVGDTVTDAAHPDHPSASRLSRGDADGLYAGIFPVDSDDVTDLKEALARLNLNDASLVFEPESSAALGFGFRCGFLGLLHMEIVQERLEREFNLSLITTAPTVEYRVRLRSGEVITIDNPEMLPDASQIDAIEEPRTKATILVPSAYVGAIMELCQERRGEFQRHGLPAG